MTTKRAIGYARCSTTRQEKSIPEQRKAIETWAAENGHALIGPRFFEDNGISGSRFAGRPGFQGLLRYCEANRDDLDVVVVWSKSRFGRPENPKEGIAYEWKLEQCGLEIVYVSTGRRSDGSIGAVFQDVAENVDAGGKLVELGGSMTRHQIETAKAGWSTGRKPPFGYDLEVVRPDGTVRHHVRYEPARGRNKYWRIILDPTTGDEIERIGPDERLEKRRSDRSRLVPGDPAHVNVVRRIYDLYLQGRGFCSVANVLNEEGAPTPNGRSWLVSGVKSAIENPVYRGALVYGKRHEGRFFVASNGKATRRKNPDKTALGHVRVKDRPEAEWIVHENAHEGLVSRKTWQAAQRALAARRGPERRTNSRGYYALSGVCTCARCGYRYQGKKTKSGKGYVSRSYRCGGYVYGGRSICEAGTVGCERIEGPIMEMIREMYFDLEDESALRKAIGGELRRDGPEYAGKQIAALRLKRSALRNKLDAMTDELIELPKSARSIMRDKIGSAAKKLEWYGAEIERIKSETRRAQENEIDVQRVMETIRDFRKLMETGDPKTLNELIRHFVAEVRIDFAKREVAVGFYPPDEVYFRDGRGDWI